MINCGVCSQGEYSLIEEIKKLLAMKSILDAKKMEKDSLCRRGFEVKVGNTSQR